ncbi:telomerase reverse transcriptase isoform X1 [Lepisosteus oculatus]|uniref:telomerase reverse transcriptase isoform X1 n=1 Tax=Lepisosteus oculatus TaxID=7918 RepID=UPI0035F504BA
MSRENIKLFDPVLRILRSVYSSVLTLEEYIAGIRFKEDNRQPLVLSTDSAKYKKFITSIIVCTSADSKALAQPTSYEQLCTLKELVSIILKKIMQKKKRNVLAHGLKGVGENCASVFSQQSNHCTSAISSGPLWDLLLQRIGTAVMMHLLESCALFTTVAPSCLYQVAGIPVYDHFITGDNYSSFKCVRLRSLHNRFNVLLQLAKSKVNFYRNRRKSQKRMRKHQKKRGAPGPRQNISKTDSEGPPTKKAKKEPGCNTIEERKQKAKKAPVSAVFFKAQSMLYSSFKSSVLSKQPKVQSRADPVKQINSNAEDLVKDIFLCRKGFDGRKKIPKRFKSMLGTFSQLLKNHRKCPFHLFLERTCSEEPTGQNTVAKATGSLDSKEPSDFQGLLSKETKPTQVYMFIRECLKYIIPFQLWGSQHNFNRFLINVKKLISMGKFDRLSLQEVLWKMRVQDCDWLKLNKSAPCPATEHRYREKILASFLTWVLGTLVIVLVRTSFYVTESSWQKNMLMFFKKKIWRRLWDMAISKHLSQGEFVSLRSEEFAKATVATVRFIPKRNGMRPIVKMGAVVEQKPYSSQSNRRKSFNIQLRNLYDILCVNVTKRPHLLGSSVFGLQDIYRVWGDFAVKNKAQNLPALPKYFVKVDIAGAFDSLPHEKLLEVVSSVLKPVMDQEYCIRRYAQIWADSNEGLKKNFRRHATTLGDLLPNMRSFTAVQQKKSNLRNAILVEQGLSMNVFGHEMLTFFQEMLANVVLRIGNKTYRQCCGIPQGSIVSTLLCSLCYGDMENRILGDLKENGCLLRLVDDFLLITPHLSKAQMFLRILAAGIPEYGCVINPQKIVANFPIDNILNCSGALQLPLECLFPWCGLLLDTHSLDIFCDYGSYAGVSIRYSLTLGSTSQPGQHMRKKLLSVLKLKCHAIFLDLKINSQQAVYLNIYKILLLQAYRFHACVINLPFGQKVHNNPTFFLTVISEMAAYSYSIIRQRNKETQFGMKNASGLLPFEAVQLLCYSAFLVKLSTHRCTYKCLLGNLKTCKRRLERKLPMDTLCLIRHVTDPPLPQDFTAMTS